MKSLDELAADWLASTGAVSEIGAWALQHSLTELLERVSGRAALSEIRQLLASDEMGILDRIERVIVDATESNSEGEASK